MRLDVSNLGLKNLNRFGNIRIMEAKKKIYIVTYGEYSDYSIDRVFSTEEKAKEYLDTKDDDYRLEEYDIDEPIERKEMVYCVYFGLEEKGTAKAEMCDWQRNKVGMIRVGKRIMSKPYLEIYVKSDSKERAIKIASERYGAVKANEKIMFPYLRYDILKEMGVVFDYNETAYFDFKTGEAVLYEGQKLDETNPFSKLVKVRRMKGE